jgi:hypothetical protein
MTKQTDDVPSADVPHSRQITWLSPPKGHISGGTVITIYGSGFKRSRVAKVRFATEAQFDEVDAEYVSESMIRCVSPPRATPDTAHVTVANDGMQFSGWPLVYTKGSGTFLKFIFDNSRPGCLDCLNSNIPLSGGRVYAGLNPKKVVEKWVLDNSTGPYIGGTLVTITATGLEWDRAGVAEYDMYIPGTTQRYNGPVGGPGTPHPHNVDPMSSGNGPPVTGTFYPGDDLKCMWQCYYDGDQNMGTGDNLTTTGLPAGVDEITESDWVPATWIDYTKITCESPPHKVPARSNETIDPTTCRVRVTNGGQDFHEDAYATWRYEDHRPTVTNIKTNQFSVWPARGPFAGNTEVTITGTNFLPSKYLKCRFGGVNTADTGGAYEQDDVSHVVGEVGGRVRYISSTEIVCVTPTFGPAAAASQYPSGSRTGTIGSGADLTIDGYGGESSWLAYPLTMTLLDGSVVKVNRTDSIGNITVVSGGKGYMTAPTITLDGGGGCCYNITSTVDNLGSITSVTVHDGGRNYNQGADAAATASISTITDGDPGSNKRQTLNNVRVTEGGHGYLVPPDVYFECSGGADDASCLATGDDSDGSAHPSWIPGLHATAVAVLGTYDPTCDNSWKDCDAQGAVVRVDITFPGRYYTSAPVVKFKPQTPKVVVTPNERALDFKDPAQVGYYSQQGKGWDELDPEQPHGSWTNGAEDTSVGYDVTDMPNGQNRMPGVSAHQTCVTTGFCPEARNPEDRGPLLPPLGKAWMDGSIKPGHQELVRVSNNYHKFGAMRGNDQSQVRTHFGYRNHTKNASIGEDLGYWMWSESGMTEAEMNRCRVSNNPPIHQFSSLQGHGLDAALGLGTADDEFQLIGPTNNLRYLDGSSVGGAPGYGAQALVTLSANDTVCAATKTCYVSHVTVTKGGQGYMYPPTVTFSGGNGYGAKATAVISGGIVVRIEVDPLSRGIGYDTNLQTEVHITAVRQSTTYDAAAPHEGVYIDKGALTYDDETSHYEHALPNGTDGGDPAARSVGHGTYTLDQSTKSVHVGQFASTSNYMVGHGAFPGHPGNQNLGHPRKDCIYFLYSDIYVSPSGSDSTGQGTAGRPYRTLQKCIDSSLAGSRDYYVYKKSDGGDRDPNVPDGSPRYGIESAGERVDATKPGMNTGTGRDKGYTGRQVRNYNERRTGWREATTGRLYGGRSWSDNTRDTQKGFGYTVNRDRCVLKDGVYWGEGNRELQPHGHMVEIWAENAQNVVIDCGGRGVGKNVFTADRHSGERASVLGSVSLQGVVMRRCTVRADPKANHRPYYPGRPGYGPGAKNPNGQSCWPGATGCQYRQAVDGQAAGQ